MADPLSWAAFGANALGGLFGGLAGGQAQKEQQGLQKRGIKAGEEQNRRQAALAEGEQAVDYSRQLSMAPLRDRLVYNLTQRAGMAPGQFRPTDMFNPNAYGGFPQQGGIDLDQLRRNQMGYTPGAGGVNTDIMTRAMEVLGYRPDGSYMSPIFRHDIRSGGVNPYGEAAHGYGPEDRHDYKPKRRFQDLFHDDSPFQNGSLFGGMR